MEGLVFVRRRTYRYPFSSANLKHDLDNIFDISYFDNRSILRGKWKATDQFLVWEKWNIDQGYYSWGALALFSGKIIEAEDGLEVRALLFPNPWFMFCFYFLILWVVSLAFSLPKGFKAVSMWDFFTPIGIASLLLFMALYFRWKLQRTVERNLEFETQQ